MEIQENKYIVALLSLLRELFSRYGKTMEEAEKTVESFGVMVQEKFIFRVSESFPTEARKQFADMFENESVSYLRKAVSFWKMAGEYSDDARLLRMLQESADEVFAIFVNNLSKEATLEQAQVIADIRAKKLSLGTIS